MNAERQDLLELMFDNKRQYQIPVYQRNYDWKKDNCLELFNDVILAYEKEKSHFLGTVVQVQKDEESGLKHFIIIDGQQRMTTIYLILKAMYDCCDNETTKEDLDDLLFNKSKTREFEKDEKTKLKLKPIKSDNDQFLLLMSNKQEQMDKASNIYINYEYFCSLIKDYVSNDHKVRNILAGLRHLVIVMISLKEPEDDPQIIFERINSTGEDLTLADLIRNYLLMTDSNMDELYEEYWLPIENKVGRDKLRDYFINYLIFKLPEVSDKHAYQQFKKYADDKTHLDVLKELKTYSKYYNVFVRNDKSYSESINNYLEGYRILKQSTIFPFFFSVFKDFDNKIITEDELNEVLEFFLNYTLRRLICGVPSNSLRGLYKTLYKRIFTSGDLKNNYLKSIYSFMAQIPSTKDVVPDDETLRNNLIYGNLYKNGNVCRFVLSTLENGLSSLKEKVLIDNNISIEHIMPQNRDNVDWKEEIGEDFDYVYDKYLHTLGNLTLTGYNSELSDSELSKKIKMLKQKTKFSFLNEDIVSADHWDEDTIVNRAKRLSTKLIEDLKLPDIFYQTINTKEAGYKRTLYDDVNYTNTKPLSFIFMGERVEISSYSEMLTKFVSLLYMLDADILTSITNRGYTFDNYDTPTFSYDSGNLRNPREINNTGLFLETNYSANQTINVIKRIIDEMDDVSYDDFIFFIDNKDKKEKNKSGIMYEEFWTRFIEFSKEIDNFDNKHISQKPLSQNWYDIAIGSSQYHIFLSLSRKKKKITCGYYFYDKNVYRNYLYSIDIMQNLTKHDVKYSEGEKHARMWIDVSIDVNNEELWTECYKWYCENINILIDLACRSKI